MNRKRIVIICPGRGSYTRDTQGYLNEYKEPHIDKINYMDKQRLKAGLTSLTDLDTTTVSYTHLTLPTICSV